MSEKEFTEKFDPSKLELSREITDADLTDQISYAKSRLTKPGVSEPEKEALRELIENAERTLNEIKGK